MRNDIGIPIAGKTYYGVRETVTYDSDTLEMINGVYPEKPEDTEEYTGTADIFTGWYDTKAEAQRYYTERRRELFPMDEPEEEDEEVYDWLEHHLSLRADADVKHAIEHGYAELGAW